MLIFSLFSLRQLQQTSVQKIFGGKEEKANESDDEIDLKRYSFFLKTCPSLFSSFSLFSLQQLQQKSMNTLFEKKESPIPLPANSSEVPVAAATPQVAQPLPEKQVEEKVCLICKSQINRYVVFPNCKTPHIYCVPCAENMLSAPAPRQPYSYSTVQPASRGKAIRCVLCQSMNPLNENGLDAFKRVVARSSESFSTGRCDRHGDMMILYYCFDCVESACVKCAPSHSQHRFDTLETAIGQSKNSLSSAVNQFADTQSALFDYRKAIEKEKEVVLKEGAQRRRELVEQMQQLRELLATAESKLLKGIKDVEDQKLHSLNSEVNWADEKERLTEESIKTVSDLMDIDNPLPFFKKITECDEILRESKCITVKKVPTRPPNASVFPPLPTRQIIRALSTISYKDLPQPYHYDPSSIGSYGYAPSPVGYMYAPPSGGYGYASQDNQEELEGEYDDDDDSMDDGQYLS